MATWNHSSGVTARIPNWDRRISRSTVAYVSASMGFRFYEERETSGGQADESDQGYAGAVGRHPE